VLVAGPGADQSGLSDCRVAHDHALDQLLMRLLIVHHRQSPLLMQRALSPARSLEFPTAVPGADDAAAVVSAAAKCMHHIRHPDWNTTSSTSPSIRYALKLKDRRCTFLIYLTNLSALFTSDNDPMTVSFRVLKKALCRFNADCRTFR